MTGEKHLSNLLNWEEDVESYARRNVDSVSITYHTYGYYDCCIKRYYTSKLPVQVSNTSPIMALKYAKELVIEVEEFEKEYGLLQPEKDDPNWPIRGYNRRMYGEHEVEFKKYHSGYVITAIRVKPQMVTIM
jgi:hypothetical protein